jgi:hypothetical protein
MPRNLFTPLDVVPIKVPLSSWTVVARIVGITETAAIAAQRVTRYARRLIPVDENSRPVQTWER